MKSLNTSTRVFTSALLGFLAALLVFPAAGYVYLRYGHPPVATADKPFPYEKNIVHIGLDARINRDLVNPPFVPSAAGLIEGAHVYVDHCAVCHGVPRQDSSFGKWEYPTAPQLWTRHPNGVVGVSDDSANVSFWKVNNGIRLTGMPSFKHILTEGQMWNVSFLIAQADRPLPPEVITILADVRVDGPTRKKSDGSLTSQKVSP